jgi:hypothetical protein
MRLSSIIVARAVVVCVGYISARHVGEDPLRDVAAGARKRLEHERFQPRSNRADIEPESDVRVGGAGRRTGVVGVEREWDAGAAARQLRAGEQCPRDKGRKHGEGVKRTEAVKLHGERLEERLGHKRRRGDRGVSSGVHFHS